MNTYYKSPKTQQLIFGVVDDDDLDGDADGIGGDSLARMGITDRF